MTLEKQVCSLELAKRLKDLGVKQDGIWKWYISNDGKETILSNGGRLPPQYLYTFSELCSAFTVAELGEMLPSSVEGFGTYAGLRLEKADGNFWTVSYESFEHLVQIEKSSPELADAMAYMLIHLIENNLIKL
jgi:hypothetical protein